jgi:hypothetical protein
VTAPRPLPPTALALLRALRDAGGTLHSSGSGCYPVRPLGTEAGIGDLVRAGLATHGGYGAATATTLTDAGRAYPLTGPMTMQDLVDGQAIADKIIADLHGKRPAAMVAGLALALAEAAHLARCGPDAAVGLFRSFYATLDAATERKL